MTRHRTYRVIAYKTETLFVDVAARNEATAIKRAEQQWDTGKRSRFRELLDYQPMRFEVDEDATDHLADVTNDDRAHWAKVALQAFDRETGSGLGEEGLHDLLCDIGHYADRAATEQVSVRHIIMAALKQHGIAITESDMIEDGRRIRS